MWKDLNNYSSEQIVVMKDQMKTALSDGKVHSNQSLRSVLNWQDDNAYWAIRNYLIKNGFASRVLRVKGGGVQAVLH